MSMYYTVFLQCGEHKIELCESIPANHNLSFLLKLVKDLPRFVSLYPSIKCEPMALMVIACSTLDYNPYSTENTYKVVNDITDIEKQASNIFILREMESKAKDIINLCPNKFDKLELKLSKFNLMKRLMDDLLAMPVPEVPFRIVGPTCIGSLSGQGPVRSKPLTEAERQEGLEISYQFVVEDEYEEEECQMCGWGDNETNLYRLNGNNLNLMKQAVDKYGGVEKLIDALAYA